MPLSTLFETDWLPAYSVSYKVQYRGIDYLYWHTHVIFRRTQFDEEITALKSEIEEYRVLSRAAETSEERKIKLIDAIIERNKTLNIILDQKSQQGK